jgi:hypothetical protein
MKKFLLFFLVMVSSHSRGQELPVKKVIDRMLSAAQSLRTARFTLYTEERLRNGKYAITERLVKFRAHPRRIYFYSVKPDPGMEVLWKAGWNDEKMLIHPSGFPYLSFSLNINGALARRDSHHPVTHIGFDYLADLLNYYRDIYKDKFYDHAVITDTIRWDNHECLVVQFIFNEYKAIDYIVQENENLIQIAGNLRLNDYSILAMNPGIRDFDDVKMSQVIQVPNVYNKLFEFYIDLSSGLPLKQLIYDDNGLYENYEMKSFRLNPALGDREFERDFPDYGF